MDKWIKDMWHVDKWTGVCGLGYVDWDGSIAHVDYVVNYLSYF